MHNKIDRETPSPIRESRIMNQLRSINLGVETRAIINFGDQVAEGYLHTLYHSDTLSCVISILELSTQGDVSCDSSFQRLQKIESLFFRETDVSERHMVVMSHEICTNLLMPTTFVTAVNSHIHLSKRATLALRISRLVDGQHMSQ